MCCLCDWWPWSVPSVVLCVGCAACGLVAVVCVGGMCCLWLLIGGLWSVTSTPCQPVSLWDGLPVVAGMCCLCLLIGGRGLCRSDGEPVAAGMCCLSVSL